MYIIKDGENKVIGIYSNGGIPVETSAALPAPAETRVGFDAVLKYNDETDSLFYDYAERPLTPEESAQETARTLSTLQEAVDTLILNALGV